MTNPTNKVNELPSAAEINKAFPVDCLTQDVYEMSEGLGARIGAFWMKLEAKKAIAYEQWKAVVFAEWIQEKHWWKSTDTRFPETLGRWTTSINGNIPVEQTLTTTELYNCEEFKEYLEKRRKEEGK